MTLVFPTKLKSKTSAQAKSLRLIKRQFALTPRFKMFDALKICSQTRCNKHKSYDQAALSEGTIDMKKSKQLHAGTM